MIAVRETLAALRRDAAQRAQLLQAIGWLGPVFWIAIWLVARVLRDRGQIGPSEYTWMLRLGVLAAVVLALVSAWLFRKIAEALVGMMTAGGAEPAAQVFSLEESMIVRGEYAQARATLEARLTNGPEDLDVALRLAELCTRHLHDTAGAERWYLTARRHDPGGRAGTTIANGLIDVYRATGQTGRLMAELARFAERWPTTAAGRAAREELRVLKQGRA